MDALAYREKDGVFRKDVVFDPQVLELVLSHKKLNTSKTELAHYLGIADDAEKDEHAQAYWAYFYTEIKNLANLRRVSQKYRDPILHIISGGAAEDKPTFQMDIWDTIYGIEALYRQGKIKEAQSSLEWLLAQQAEDGGWQCSTHYDLADTDTAAAALMTMKNFSVQNEVKIAAAKSFEWLDKLRQMNGAYVTFPGKGGLACAEVTTAVAVAFKSWEKTVEPETLDYLESNQTSTWYPLAADRLRSGLLYLGVEPQINEINSTYLDLMAYADGVIEEKSLEHCAQLRCPIRYIGNITLTSPAWSAALEDIARTRLKRGGGRLLV